VVAPQALEAASAGPPPCSSRMNLEKGDGRSGRHDLGDVRRSQPHPGVAGNGSTPSSHAVMAPTPSAMNRIRPVLGWRVPPTSFSHAPAGM